MHIGPGLQESQVSVNYKQVNSWKNQAKETDANMKHIEEEEHDIEVVCVIKKLEHFAPYARKGGGPQDQA